MTSSPSISQSKTPPDGNTKSRSSRSMVSQARPPVTSTRLPRTVGTAIACLPAIRSVRVEVKTCSMMVSFPATEPALSG